MCLSGCNNPSKPSSGPAAACPVDGSSPACPTVKVVINLSQPVACPGHPLSITAVGTPSGGQYSWTVTGDGELVDTAGTAVSTGATVNLRSFKPDDAAGNIPQRLATLKVTYTHPQGTATDTKNVTIHKIDFEVTNTAVMPGVTQVNELPAGVVLGNAPGMATMSTTPSVKIKLDPSCPRKPDCAANHQVGFLQTVVTNDRRIRYTNTLIQVTVVLPIRDQIAGPAPFYNQSYGGGLTGLVPFSADGDTEVVHHEDSPSQNAAWSDPRVAAPGPPPATNRQLRQLFFSNGFHVWLVVQNIEWSRHDPGHSFVYLRNYSWSMSLNVAVDTTKLVGSRCTPTSHPPTIGAVSIGKGASDPNLSAPYPNVNNNVTVTAAPTI